MKISMEKKFIKRFAICSLVMALVCIGIVVLFDPFFHYHDAVKPLKHVLEERDYQVAGTLDHFDYNAVILGNSVAENDNNAWYDEAFDVTAIKAVKAAGSNSDLMFYLDRAYETHELDKVFYNIKIDMLKYDTNDNFAGQDYYYLINNNPFDDAEYLLNKDVLLKKIPIMLAYSFVLDYDEGESYSWYRTKEYSVNAVTSRYEPLEYINEARPLDENQDFLDANIKLIVDRVSAHPETEFYIFIPPSSAVWWDNEYREGRVEQNLYQYEQFCDSLLDYDNVHIFAFFADESMTYDLSAYMDSVHFKPDFNKYMVDCMVNGDYLVTKESVKDYSQMTYEFIYKFSNELILEYYPNAVVNAE